MLVHRKSCNIGFTCLTGSRQKWLALATLSVLLAVLTCLFGTAVLIRPVTSPSGRPQVQTLRVGRVSLMSGVTAMDNCSAFGPSVNSWTCPSQYFAETPGQPTAFRLWLLVVARGRDVRAFKLIDLPIQFAAP